MTCTITPTVRDSRYRSRTIHPASLSQLRRTEAAGGGIGRVLPFLPNRHGVGGVRAPQCDRPRHGHLWRLRLFHPERLSGDGKRQAVGRFGRLFSQAIPSHRAGLRCLSTAADLCRLPILSGKRRDGIPAGSRGYEQRPPDDLPAHRWPLFRQCAVLPAPQYDGFPARRRQWCLVDNQVGDDRLCPGGAVAGRLAAQREAPNPLGPGGFGRDRYRRRLWQGRAVQMDRGSAVRPAGVLLRDHHELAGRAASAAGLDCPDLWARPSPCRLFSSASRDLLLLGGLSGDLARRCPLPALRLGRRPWRYFIRGLSLWLAGDAADPLRRRGRLVRLSDGRDRLAGDGSARLPLLASHREARAQLQEGPGQGRYGRIVPTRHLRPRTRGRGKGF